MLDVDANELALVYRARGLDATAAADRAAVVLGSLDRYREQQVLDASLLRSSTALPGDEVPVPAASGQTPAGPTDEHETIGTAWGAAISSFCFFSVGAAIPVLPYLLGAVGLTAVLWSAGLVGIALLGTGSVVGVLSGAAPVKRALRQLAIGYGAAAVTYLLGALFGTSAS